MKSSPLLLALALSCAPLSSAEQIVTIGDSLTFAYEAEFCFSQNIVGIGTVGDGFPARVRNWIEILSNPAYRGAAFGLGTRDNVTVSVPGNTPFNLYFRQSQNWSVPGLKVEGVKRLVTGDPTASFSNLISTASEFNNLGLILGFSDFNNATDFNTTDLRNQIQGTAQRLVISVGGNDIKEIYGTIYNGGSAGTFVADYMANMVAILNEVQTLNPNIQIVVTNVPHVGITPNVRVQYPYHPTFTGYVSAVLSDLNGQLATLAEQRKIGYADIYKQTVSMIDDAKPLCIHGITFGNNGTTSGEANPAWLNGTMSKNFHPNTSGQVVIANEIIHAFNKRYRTGIAPLTATEIHTAVTPKTPVSNFDMPFNTWMNRYSLNGLPTTNDADGDGIPAGTEFALGLNPIVSDADKVSSGIVTGAMELAYPLRLPSTSNCTVTAEFSSTPAAPFTPFAAAPTPGSDGLFHARRTVGATPQFLRLKVTIPRGIDWRSNRRKSKSGCKKGTAFVRAERVSDQSGGLVDFIRPMSRLTMRIGMRVSRRTGRAG